MSTTGPLIISKTQGGDDAITIRYLMGNSRTNTGWHESDDFPVDSLGF
jgi:hypothetical protein